MEEEEEEEGKCTSIPCLPEHEDGEDGEEVLEFKEFPHPGLDRGLHGLQRLLAKDGQVGLGEGGWVGGWVDGERRTGRRIKERNQKCGWAGGWEKKRRTSRLLSMKKRAKRARSFLCFSPTDVTRPSPKTKEI